MHEHITQYCAQAGSDVLFLDIICAMTKTNNLNVSCQAHNYPCSGIGLKPITLGTSKKEAHSRILRYGWGKLSDMSCLMISEVFNFIFMNQSAHEAWLETSNPLMTLGWNNHQSNVNSWDFCVVSGIWKLQMKIAIRETRLRGWVRTSEARSRVLIDSCKWWWSREWPKSRAWCQNSGFRVWMDGSLWISEISPANHGIGKDIHVHVPIRIFSRSEGMIEM
jgi:hypothetical protein